MHPGMSSPECWGLWGALKSSVSFTRWLAEQGVHVVEGDGGVCLDWRQAFYVISYPWSCCTDLEYGFFSHCVEASPERYCAISMVWIYCFSHFLGSRLFVVIKSVLWCGSHQTVSWGLIQMDSYQTPPWKQAAIALLQITFECLWLLTDSLDSN